MGLDGNLKARLNKQFSQESETIQAATSEQLNAMRSELSSTYKHALSTIEADMQAEGRGMARRFRRLMLWPSLALLVTSLAICIGAWAWTQYQYQQIQQQRQTLLELDTLGIEVVEQEGRKYVLMPSGATSHQLESGQVYVRLEK